MMRRKESGAPTIRDVARAASVSIGTASRVINNKESVRPQIRQRVEQAIATLGYRPNAVAQSMRRRSTHIVGCIIREINIPSLAAFVRAAHDVLDAAGFSLLITNSEGLPARERELLNRITDQRADGILLGPYTPIDAKFDAFLRGLDTPMVLVDRDEPGWADAVMADHAAGTYAATRRLLELGHRRILMLTGERDLYPARERLKGYRKAFAEFDLPVDESLVRATGFLAVQGFRHTSSVIGGSNPPTAVIAGGIDMLAGVLRAIRVRGLSVPGDVSVVAAGDSELAELYSPAITIERWDQAEIGRTAAHLLLRRMEHGPDAPPEHILLPTEFIPRASIGVPPATARISA